MRFFKSIAVPVTLVLGGCTAVPDLPKQDELSVTDIVENVRCEFQDAGEEAEFLRQGYGWTIGAEMQMQVVNGMETVLDTSYSVPASSVFFPALSGRYASSADATRSIGISLNYGDKKTFSEGRRNCDEQALRGKSKRLKGKLGLSDWVATIQKTVNETHVMPNKASFTLEFVLERSASATPGFGSFTEAVHAWKITPKLGGSNKHVHRLIVALTQNAAPSKPILVTVVGPDGKQRIIRSQQPSTENEDRNQFYLQSITPQKRAE